MKLLLPFAMLALIFACSDNNKMDTRTKGADAQKLKVMELTEIEGSSGQYDTKKENDTEPPEQEGSGLNEEECKKKGQGCIWYEEAKQCRYRRNILHRSTVCFSKGGDWDDSTLICRDKVTGDIINISDLQDMQVDCSSSGVDGDDPTAKEKCPRTDPLTIQECESPSEWDWPNCTCRIAGCMDPNAKNYNSLATIEDGSCVYSYERKWCPDLAADWGQEECIEDPNGDGIVDYECVKDSSICTYNKKEACVAEGGKWVPRDENNPTRNVSDHDHYYCDLGDNIFGSPVYGQ